MRDPDELYTVDDDVADEVGDAPVMVQLVHGFVDAGSAGQIAAEHLVERFAPRRLVTFDVDELVDYRSRRPAMTFDQSTWNDYDEPVLAIDVLRDREGAPFLLLHGVEPDIRWEAWVAAVRQVVERFGVRLVVGLHGIPMGVPHTRPLGFTAHATRPDLVDRAPVLVRHRPGAGERERAARAPARPVGPRRDGLRRARAALPRPVRATRRRPWSALGQVEKATGLDLASGALESAAREAAAEIERQIAASPEVRRWCTRLERQYDDAVRSLDGPGRSRTCRRPTSSVPSSSGSWPSRTTGLPADQ